MHLSAGGDTIRGIKGRAAFAGVAPGMRYIV